MPSAIASRWTFLDDFIQKFRFRVATKYIPKNSILVDVGCGNGAFLSHVGNLINNGVGLDGSIEDKQLSPKLRLIKCQVDKELLPLGDSSVDVVTSLAVLEHLNNVEYVLAEIKRILRPGGKFIFTTPSPMAKPVLEFLAFRLGVISKADIEDHKHYYSRSELESMLTDFSSFAYYPFQFGLNQLFVLEK